MHEQADRPAQTCDYQAHGKRPSLCSFDVRLHTCAAAVRDAGHGGGFLKPRAFHAVCTASLLQPCMAHMQAGLRQAYALGVDRAVHINEEGPGEPLGVAQLLVALAKREQPGLLLLGKQTIDGDHNQTVRTISHSHL